MIALFLNFFQKKAKHKQNTQSLNNSFGYHKFFLNLTLIMTLTFDTICFNVVFSCSETVFQSYHLNDDITNHSNVSSERKACQRPNSMKVILISLSLLDIQSKTDSECYLRCNLPNKASLSIISDKKDLDKVRRLSCVFSGKIKITQV